MFFFIEHSHAQGDVGKAVFFVQDTFVPPAPHQVAVDLDCLVRHQV